MKVVQLIQITLEDLKSAIMGDIQIEIDELKNLLVTQDKDMQKIKAKVEKVTKISQEISSEMYQQAAQTKQAAQDTHPQRNQQFRTNEKVVDAGKNGSGGHQSNKVGHDCQDSIEPADLFEELRHDGPYGPRECQSITAFVVECIQLLTCNRSP